MLLKLASYAVVLAVGAGGGIYWGVNHPQQAQSIADLEKTNIEKIKAAAFAQGQQSALQQVVNDQTVETQQTTTPAKLSRLDKYKSMLKTAQDQFNDAKSKIGN